MDIKAELLDERIKVLESQFDMAIANANAVEGMIREARYWKSVLLKEETKDKEETKELDS